MPDYSIGCGIGHNQILATPRSHKDGIASTTHNGIVWSFAAAVDGSDHVTRTRVQYLPDSSGPEPQYRPDSSGCELTGRHVYPAAIGADAHTVYAERILSRPQDFIVHQVVRQH